VLEIRFVTGEPWTTLPGLLYTHVRERYIRQRDLPLAGLPDEIRRQDPALAHLPLVQFLSNQFTLQFGPRVLSLVTKAHEYPGWPALAAEMRWIVDRVKASGFMGEAERLSARYIDFFPGDVFEHLILRAFIGDQPFPSKDLSLSTVLREGPYTERLSLSNSAMLSSTGEARKGSVLDLDAWIGALDFRFEDAMSAFGDLHLLVKQTFFGLLKPEFLASLKPSYA
jgi:uncharacterized protein (TIGR04255 family)